MAVTISAKAVAALRAKTGCGMMECKKALVETEGDEEKAIKVLREKGLATAAKKADRIAAEGMVDILRDGNRVAMIEVNSETDFVAKNDEFKKFVRGLLATILAENPADVEALKACKFDGSDITVADKLVEMIATIKENMSIRRFVTAQGYMSTYIHGAGQTGVVVLFDTTAEVAAHESFAEVTKNVALQVAAMNCQYANKEDVPESVYNEEKEIQLNLMKNDPKNASKPAQILEKMITGKMGKFYENICLAEQAYVKDDSMSVKKYLETEGKAMGGALAVKAFLRYEKGEGLQKREDNFAEEIANMVKG